MKITKVLDGPLGGFVIDGPFDFAILLRDDGAITTVVPVQRDSMTADDYARVIEYCEQIKGDMES